MSSSDLPAEAKAAGTPRRQLRLLMLTYFYPPMGGAGVQRMLKFTRYLPDSGIDPVVVSAEGGGYPRDDSLLSEIPAGTDVTRLRHTPLTARLLSLKRRLPHSSANVLSGQDRRSRPSTAWRDRLLEAWGAVQFPDDKVGWSHRARKEAIRKIAQVPVDIVLSSAPPVSAHMAAMHVAQHAGVPWVADFRDLWTGNPGYAAPAWRRGFDRSTERRLLAAADGIVTVSEPLEAMLANLASPGVATITIPNGYDEGDFTGVVRKRAARGTYRIVHTGTFYGHRSPEPFLRGVQRWLDENEAARNRLRIRFIGSIGSRFDAALEAFASHYPDVLERRGYIAHAEALSELASADALLLVVGGGDAARGVVTGKVFEYLRAARPILLVGSAQSEAARLVRDCGAGEVVDELRTEEVATVLDRWIVQGAAPKPDRSRAAPYERKLLTRQLADFLFSVHERFHSVGRKPT